MFASRADAGTLAPPEELPPISSCTQLCIMSSTVCLREIPGRFVLWMLHSTPCEPLRISSFAWIARLVLASFQSIRQKLVSSWPLLTRSTAKSCTWSSTAAFVDAPLLRTCRTRAFRKWLFTLSGNPRLVSDWPLPVVILKLPWRLPLRWSNKQSLDEKSGANLETRRSARVITKSSKCLIKGPRTLIASPSCTSSPVTLRSYERCSRSLKCETTLWVATTMPFCWVMQRNECQFWRPVVTSRLPTCVPSSMDWKMTRNVSR
mmetsp:Transcript_61092/g.171173  ORF Transcript_61092/g.171173 Transcript_61092/m.171173 type:complete len:262 (-) Transcript_61092:98-883(-)